VTLTTGHGFVHFQHKYNAVVLIAPGNPNTPPPNLRLDLSAGGEDAFTVPTMRVKKRK